MEYGKNTIQEFAEEIREQCQNGASQSDIIQMIEAWQKPLVQRKSNSSLTTSWKTELSKINSCPQRQDSLKNQLQDLRIIANKFGFYDAADFLKER